MVTRGGVAGFVARRPSSKQARAKKSLAARKTLASKFKLHQVQNTVAKLATRGLRAIVIVITETKLEPGVGALTTTR